MRYLFENFELDRSRMELRGPAGAIAVEPQVFALLHLLVENRDRLLTRDEIIEKVWDGRAVSDSALDSRIKSVRRALGDDGKAQRLVRTVHGQGFRFVGDARVAAVERSAPAPEALPTADTGRPSIAVLPFRLVGTSERWAAVAEALPDELIAELARLRWLFVIARGSSFRFRSDVSDPVEVGKLLGMRYCLTGTVELSETRMTVGVQLIDTRDGRVVWADRFASAIADVHATRAEIVARVISALELQIPLHEAQAVRVAAPEDLDAWAAYHLGLQRMFRFHRGDNAAAGELFARAAAADPRFARAHAGLSFVHFQNAFLEYTPDADRERDAARRTAERAVELDPLDPFVNLMMGRSFWLAGDLDTSLGWLERATALSPSYAQGIYARAWTHVMSGRGEPAKADADAAMALSPLDPLHYAMSATRAISHIVCDEKREAAEWAERGAREPGAHVLIALIAAAAHTMNGDRERAAVWVGNARERAPGVSAAVFFRAFPFDPHTKARIAGALSTFDL